MKKKESLPPELTGSCPVPLQPSDRILLAHGGGGKLSARLFDEMIRPMFSNPWLDMAHDGAVLSLPKGRLAFTTDSFVVHPLFFPGGNIGDLAVNGTVNDLACCGATPLYLSLALLIEEGFETILLKEILRSIRDAGKQAGIQIVTGDTKVVEKGKGDQLFINTSGIGLIPEGIDLAPQYCRPGDRILLSGNLAEHGMAVLSLREGLSFESSIRSDTAPLNQLANEILHSGAGIRVFRDPTRGGLSSTLNEISRSCGYRIRIQEEALPLSEQVKGACEILGLDPLYIANEGKLVVFTAPEDEKKVLELMRRHPQGKNAACIGEVLPSRPPLVEMETIVGSTRVLDMISGEQLPRIC